MSSASRGLSPREGLDCLVDEDGSYRPVAQPRRGPQAGKSGDPRSQNADRRALLHGEAKGRARSAAGPKSLRPWLTRGG